MAQEILETQATVNDETLIEGYLTFQLDEELFGIDISNVIEIIGVQPITHLPEVAHYIKGIINLRGRIIPVIDMRLRFQKETVEYNDRTCVIVVEVQDVIVGLIVDNVAEVMKIDENQIVMPPERGSIQAQSKYISGIGKAEQTVILLLDCEKLLQEEESVAESREV